MSTKTKSQSNKPLTFWQRLKIAKANRIKVKSTGISFLKEICKPTKKELTRTDLLMGYLHYEAGLPLIQISNDLNLGERYTKQLNENLLVRLGIKIKTPLEGFEPPTQ